MLIRILITCLCFKYLTDTRYYKQSAKPVRFYDSYGCKIEIKFFIA